MGQLKVPSYPFDTEFITPILSVSTQDNFVYYLLSGMPIYSHEKKDLYKFHYITSYLIIQGLCKVKDIVKTFHISSESVKRNKKSLSEIGDSAFFNKDFNKVKKHNSNL